MSLFGSDPRCGIVTAVKQRFWSAVLTDVHFWVPVIVLVFGAGLLISLR